MRTVSVVAPEHPISDLLSVEEGTAYLGCSLRFLRELVAQRQVPVVRIGRFVRLRRGDLDAYVAACTAPALRGPLALAEASLSASRSDRLPASAAPSQVPRRGRRPRPSSPDPSAA
jgi:excisionase family DNA binding protein